MKNINTVVYTCIIACNLIAISAMIFTYIENKKQIDAYTVSVQEYENHPDKMKL